MWLIFTAIAPVFILIVLGYGLRRGGIPSTEFWNLNDRLVYWVLIPALFFSKISAADLGGDLKNIAVLLYPGFFVSILLGALIGIAMAAPQAASLIQGSARFNTFIALAIAESLYGAPGLQAAVLASAILVPVVNVTVVTTMTYRLGGSSKGVFRGLVRNPLILSIGAGVIFNVLGLHDVPVLHESTQILGNAALPIMLLCVGASLKLRGLSGSRTVIALSVVPKFIVFPLVVFSIGYALSLDPLLVQVALIYAALPTGVASYTLAREMGGDAPLMAAIITVQTLISFVTIPLTLFLAQTLLS